MLLNAGVRNGGGPMRFFGGVTAASVERARWCQPGEMINIHAGQATVVGGTSVSNKSGRPQGYLPPRSWSMPIKRGGMASRFLITGTGTVTPAMQAGWPSAAALTGTGTLNASLVGAYLASAGLTGAGTLASTLTAQANIVSALTGMGAVQASMLGAFLAQAALNSTGTLSPGLTAQANAVSALTGTGTLSSDLVGVYLAEADLNGSAAVVAVITALADAAAALDSNATLIASGSAAAGLEAALLGIGTLSGSATASVPMASALAANGALTAAMVGAALAQSALTGSSVLVSDLEGVFAAEADLSATTALVLVMTAKGAMLAPLTGAGVLSSALYAQANMECDISQTQTGGGCNPNEIADAVWSHVTAYNLVSDIDALQVQNGVYIDTISGSDLNAGTATAPVLTATRAHIIAAANNLSTFFVRGTLTLDRNTLNWKFRGQSEALTHINFNGFNVDGSYFHCCDLTGAMAGQITARDSMLAAVTGLDGVFHHCGFSGTTSVAATADVLMKDCFAAGAADAAPIFSFGANSDTRCRAWVGNIELHDLTVGSTVSIDLAPGRCVLDASCIGGTAILRGLSQIENNAAGTTVVDAGLVEAELVNKAALAAALAAS